MIASGHRLKRNGKNMERIGREGGVEILQIQYHCKTFSKENLKYF